MNHEFSLCLTIERAGSLQEGLWCRQIAEPRRGSAIVFLSYGETFAQTAYASILPSTPPEPTSRYFISQLLLEFGNERPSATPGTCAVPPPPRTSFPAGQTMFRIASCPEFNDTK